MKLSIPAYTARVRDAFRARGVAPEAARTMALQASPAVLRGHRMGVSPDALVSSIMGPAPQGRPVARGRGRPGLAMGMTRGRGWAAGGGCPTVPVEAWMLGPGEWELPPQPECHAPPRGAAATSARFNTSKKEEFVRSVFGNSFTIADLERAYSGKNNAGVVIRPKLRQVTTPSKEVIARRGGDGAITCFFDVYAGSDHIGFMTRSFYREAGKLNAHHDVFDLDEKVAENMGRGVGESVTRNALRTLKSWGFTHITTRAAWVGRYVWASFGWSWEDIETANEAFENLIAYLDERVTERGIYMLRGRSLAGSFDFRTVRDFKNAWRAARTFHYAWNLASLELTDRATGKLVHVGRTMLAGIRSARDPEEYEIGEEGIIREWSGIMVLRDGHPTWERARVRLKL